MTTVLQSVPVSSIPAVAWKNGGGTTRTLTAQPEGASFDDFLWRVSIADVAVSGPFSRFPGIDRTIVLLDGDGMTLAASDGSRFELTTPFEPHSFPGETEIEGKLAWGPSRDFNVMTRRGAAESTVECLREESLLSENIALLYCAQGSFRLVGGDQADTTIPQDSFLGISDLTTGGRIVPEQPGSVLISVCITLAGQK